MTDKNYDTNLQIILNEKGHSGGRKGKIEKVTYLPTNYGNRNIDARSGSGF